MKARHRNTDTKPSLSFLSLSTRDFCWVFVIRLGLIAASKETAYIYIYIYICIYVNIIYN